MRRISESDRDWRSLIDSEFNLPSKVCKHHLDHFLFRIDGHIGLQNALTRDIIGATIDSASSLHS